MLKKLIKWIFGKKEPIIFLETDGHEIIFLNIVWSNENIFTKLEFKKLIWIERELLFQTKSGLEFVSKQNWSEFFDEHSF